VHRDTLTNMGWLEVVDFEIVLHQCVTNVDGMLN